jgi:hypothetical protein
MGNIILATSAQIGRFNSSAQTQNTWTDHIPQSIVRPPLLMTVMFLERAYQGIPSQTPGRNARIGRPARPGHKG